MAQTTENLMVKSRPLRKGKKGSIWQESVGREVLSEVHCLSQQVWWRQLLGRVRGLAHRGR